MQPTSQHSSRSDYCTPPNHFCPTCRYVLKNLMRDWSADGAPERTQSYGRIIKELSKRYEGWQDPQHPPRVLVPGESRHFPRTAGSEAAEVPHKVQGSCCLHAGVLPGVGGTLKIPLEPGGALQGFVREAARVIRPRSLPRDGRAISQASGRHHEHLCFGGMMGCHTGARSWIEHAPQDHGATALEHRAASPTSQRCHAFSHTPLLVGPGLGHLNSTLHAAGPKCLQSGLTCLWM